MIVDDFPVPIRLTERNSDELLFDLYYTNRELAREAFKLGCTVEVYPHTALFRVVHNRKNYYFHYMQTPLNTYVGSRLANNKLLTKTLLYEDGLPVPMSMKLSKKRFQNGDWSVEGFKYPLVVKPARSSEGGTGVITNITSRRLLLKTLKSGFRKYPSLLIEHFYSTFHDYRILVLDNTFVAATRRIPASVVGDGIHSIKKLISLKNASRAVSTDTRLKPIRIDQQLRAKVHDQRLTMNSIIRKGRRVQLRDVCNVGAGGETHDVTDEVSPENKAIAVRAAKAIGLRYAGVDFLCPDVKRSIRKTGGVILEVNQHPGINGHMFPIAGKPRNVAKRIIKSFISDL